MSDEHESHAARLVPHPKPNVGLAAHLRHRGGAMSDELVNLLNAVKHRHRRGESSWTSFGCSCGLEFWDPRERDEHVYKANEATWESWDYAIEATP